MKGWGTIRQNDIVVFNYPTGDTIVSNPKFSAMDYYKLTSDISAKLNGGYPSTADSLSAWEERQAFDRFLAKGRQYIAGNEREFGRVATRPVDRRENYVKRCVGLPGQTLEIKDRIIYLDGKANKEPDNVQYFYQVATTRPIPEKVRRELGISLEDLKGRNASGTRYFLPLTGRMADDLRSRDFVTSVTLMPQETDGGLYPLNKHTGWSEGLDLKEIVAMFIDCAEGDGACPGIKGIAVDAEAERTRQRGEECIVPVFLMLLVAFHYLLKAHLQPLEQKGRKPAVDGQRRKVAHDAVAGRVMVFLEQGIVAAADGVGDGKHQLGDELPVATVDGGIALANDMEDDGVVALVLVVMVEVPVGGFHVKFHVAHPFGAIDDDLGAREVGTCVGVGQSGVNDLHRLAVDGAEGGERKHLVFPYVVQQFFHGTRKNLGKNSGFLAKMP